jgi:hypothetical protein
MASKKDSQFPLTRKYMTEYGKQVTDEMKTRLLNAKRTYKSGTFSVGINTGSLFYSLKYRTGENDNEFFVTFFMNEYGQYVDKGVRPQPKYLKGKGSGRSNFISALKKWCKKKGLDEGMAFPIRRNIWKFGIKPTNFFTIPTTRRQKQFEQMVAKNMAKDIDNNIK